MLALGAAAAGLGLALGACGGGDDGGDGTPAPAVSTVAASTGTPAPPDPEAARLVFLEFVDAVAAGDAVAAWALYAASIEGTTEDHRAEMGCAFAIFRDEMPRFQHLFARIAPFEFVASHGSAPGSLITEWELRTADGNSMLLTLTRVEPSGPYRVVFLNSGQVSAEPGAPDPFPSPEDPKGFCGIWTGAR